jgi:MFS family permease
VPDCRILYAAAFLRALGTAMLAVLLAIYLARLEFSIEEIGHVVSAGLWGAAAASLAATLLADRRGRRRMLLELALLGALGALAVCVVSHRLAMMAASFLGMLNGMGRDRGAAVIVEQAILPATGSDERRTQTFAIYNVFQDAGHALGSLLAGLPSLLAAWTPISETAADRLAIGLYAVLMAVTGLLYARLSAAVDVPAGRALAPVSRQSRRLLARISALFALDGLGGGFLSTALLSYFFFKRFDVGEGLVAALFFLARLANALSHLAAAWLARRIGLVNTMVFTHVPSSLFLVSVAFAPNFPVAAVLFLLREGLVEMDVPTRQSYVMAVVRPEERTVASGVTHLVRLGAWAVAPSLAGMVMGGIALSMPLFVGAGMKISYDVLLYCAFRSVRPPEENLPGPGSAPGR